MGQESDCTVTWKRRKYVGRAHLDSRHLRFRADDGSLRLDIPFNEVNEVESTRGGLRVHCNGAVASFDLGTKSDAWRTKIRYPKPRIDKLGVKPGMRVSVLRIDDREFLGSLEARTEDIGRGRTRKESDIVFLGIDASGDLARLKTLECTIKRDGAVWVIWPKGRDQIKQGDVMRAAKDAGLVDIKVVSFSETHSALKLVIPKSRR